MTSALRGDGLCPCVKRVDRLGDQDDVHCMCSDDTTAKNHHLRRIDARHPAEQHAQTSSAARAAMVRIFELADPWERTPQGKYRIKIRGNEQCIDVPDRAYVANVRNSYSEAIM